MLLRELADFQRVGAVAIRHSPHHGLGEVKIASEISGVRERLAARQWLEVRAALVVVAEATRDEIGQLLTLRAIRGQFSADQGEKILGARRSVVIDRVLAGKIVARLSVFIKRGPNAGPCANNPSLPDRRNDAFNPLQQVLNIILSNP